MVAEQKTCPTQRKDPRDREPPPPPPSQTRGMEPQQSWREGTPPQGRPLGLDGASGGGTPRKPQHHRPHRRHKPQQTSAGGQSSTASRKHKPKPTCADDAGCPPPGQCSPTFGPSASLRAPLPSSAFCLGHSSCLHLASPLTLQLRETTRPCLGPPWAAAWRPPGGQWKLSWAHLPRLPSCGADLPVLPLDQHGNHPFPGLVQVPSILQLW